MTEESRPGRRATQSDVARLAGVDRSVVSAVINGDRARGRIGVGAETRERVWAAVRELDYAPNVAARQLASGRNNLIGVFTHRSAFPIDSKDFFHEFLVGIEREVDAQGYNLLMFTSARDESGERAVYSHGRNALRIADGAILLGDPERRDDLVRLANEHFPYVTVGRRVAPGVEVSWVAVDYAEGVRRLIGELVSLGHRRIAWAGPVRDNEPSQDRRQGYARGMADHQLSELDSFEAVDRAPDTLAGLLERGATAIVVGAHWELVELRRQARRLGCRIPEDVSLVSLGGLSATGPAREARMIIPRHEIGRQAVEVLLERIADPTAEAVQRMVRCDLDLRFTVAPPPV